MHLNVFRQDDGALVSKLPLFEPGKGAVENSVVAYRDHLIVGNTYGYFDPFKENETAGGYKVHTIDGLLASDCIGFRVTIRILVNDAIVFFEYGQRQEVE